MKDSERQIHDEAPQQIDEKLSHPLRLGSGPTETSIFFNLALAALLLFSILLALFTGRYPVPGITIPLKSGLDPTLVNIILLIRLPRILTAVTAGAVLAGSGFIFQMLFANPLVEPGFLGVSQGASFGAALSIILFGSSPFMVQGLAFICAITGLALSLFLASRFHFGGWILRLILAGIAVSAFFSAGLGLLKHSADPLGQLQDITYWLLGGLWNSSWSSLISILPLCSGSLIMMVLYRWRINILSLDDRTAFAAGVSPRWEKRLVLAAATAGAAAAISVTGLVGWIGLIVPHLSRRIVGADSRRALPVSLLLGALYLLFGDTFGRTLLSGELPLGILTSMTGTILFVILLSSKRNLGETV